MDLTKIVPANYIEGINQCEELFKINTALRIAHFLSQMIHESGNFKFKEENLNYSADGLMKTFPKYFSDVNVAKKYSHQPDKIANYVYANRMGNGNSNSGDGWKYRGGGFGMITGRDNYTSLSNDTGIDFVNNPELIHNDDNAVLSFGWFWNKRNLNKIADLGDDEETITKVSIKVNGGKIGLQDRIAIFNRIYPLLNS